MSLVAERLTQLRQHIAVLERRYAREAGSVKLVGIAKTHDASIVRQAVEAGLSDIGESYVQEALPKIAELSGLGITWHFVGRIQGNKTADIAACFDWVHSIDRARVAERLDAQRPDALPPLQCCLQVRLSDEGSKGGVAIEELETLASRVVELPRLRLRGLMALPAPVTGLETQRVAFAQLAASLASLARRYPWLDTLSMGMSDDMEAAIAEGATMVRIGTALFGPRGSQGNQL